MCVCFKSGVVCDGLVELLGSNAAAALLLGRQRSFLIRGGKIPEGLSTLLTGTQPKVAEPAPKTQLLRSRLGGLSISTTPQVFQNSSDKASMR